MTTPRSKPVIPAAGLATRFRPATTAMSELRPWLTPFAAGLDVAGASAAMPAVQTGAAR